MAGAKEKTRSSSAGLRFLSLVAALAPAPAAAGAWIAPEGGQEILTTVAGERDGLSFYESSAYWEAPLGASTAFVLTPWVEQNTDTLEGWRGEATLALKQTVFRRGESVMALQGGAVWQSHPQPGCSEGGVELRWLGGRSFEGGRFLNVEAASRVQDGGCGGERLDVTAGFRPAPNWMAMGQVFTDLPRAGGDVVRAQLTLVRFGESGRAIQFGLRGRVDGEVQEAAFVLGFWGRPGD